jgi:hypothetical protein
VDTTSPEIHPTACQQSGAKWLTYCQFRLIPCPPNPNAEENQQQACTAEPMQTWQVSASKNEFTLKFSITFQKRVTSEIQEGRKIARGNSADRVLAANSTPSGGCVMEFPVPGNQ